MLFSAFITDWVEKYAKDSLSPSTFKVYTDYIRTPILPKLGNFKMDEIRPMHIVNILTDLRKPKTRKDGREGPPKSLNYSIYLFCTTQCL